MNVEKTEVYTSLFTDDMFTFLKNWRELTQKLWASSTWLRNFVESIPHGWHWNYSDEQERVPAFTEHVFQLGKWTTAYKNQRVYNEMSDTDGDHKENQGKSMNDGDAHTKAVPLNYFQH